jgi:mannan endo-1,4-beta-mannosidase
VAQQYIARGIVPMVEYHSATCKTDAASLSTVVDLWVGPDKAWLQSLERNVILNIANEWGANDTVWRDSYKTAVMRLRQAGIKNMLVIDAGGECGQNPESIETWGTEIFASDPEKNVAFSVHMYGFWHNPGAADRGSWNGRQPYDMDQELGTLEATGLPVIVGEFSWNGLTDVGYDTRMALSTYEKHHMGWIAWMWFNPGGDVNVNLANNIVYATTADLSTFGRLVIEDPTLGLKANSRPATTF